jgi:hypothetical protein
LTLWVWLVHLPRALHLEGAAVLKFLVHFQEGAQLSVLHWLYIFCDQS